LKSAIEHLAHDPVVAVRSRAIEPLLALLNTRTDIAIRWFVECVAADPVLLVTPLVERFVYFGGHRDYTALRPLLQQMLSSTEVKAAVAAARVCCLLALDVEEAEQDARQTRGGSAVLRKTAVTIYATNAAHNEVGAACRSLLRPFFADSDDAVRVRAAEAFWHLADLGTAEQSELLAAFLDANPGAAALEPVIRAVEDSPVRLPDLVCRLVEAGIEAFETEAGDIRTSAAGTASDLSKIIIRLYTQSEDQAIRRRCLDAVDRMERAGFFGLAEELLLHDR
jgi:phage tail protein X